MLASLPSLQCVASLWSGRASTPEKSKRQTHQNGFHSHGLSQQVRIAQQKTFLAKPGWVTKD